MRLSEMLSDHIDGTRKQAIEGIINLLEKAKIEHPEWDDFYLENGYANYPVANCDYTTCDVDVFVKHKNEVWVCKGSPDMFLCDLDITDAIAILNLLETQALYELPVSER